eukprot:TRINITY_DN7768_c0_g3_i3.p1 TRINITY_DN7768_c0_g3~~TRINITY_DN7768_c0_g3_i3.p1  ORF type:complete len:339 (-),score=66.36 TRINITY_DN7768_c0_g3_i3:490-1506(-)
MPEDGSVDNLSPIQDVVSDIADAEGEFLSVPNLPKKRKPDHRQLVDDSDTDEDEYLRVKVRRLHSTTANRAHDQNIPTLNSPTEHRTTNSFTLKFDRKSALKTSTNAVAKRLRNAPNEDNRGEFVSRVSTTAKPLTDESDLYTTRTIEQEEVHHEVGYMKKVGDAEGNGDSKRPTSEQEDQRDRIPKKAIETGDGQISKRVEQSQSDPISLQANEYEILPERIPKKPLEAVREPERIPKRAPEMKNASKDDSDVFQEARLHGFNIFAPPEPKLPNKHSSKMRDLQKRFFARTKSYELGARQTRMSNESRLLTEPETSKQTFQQDARFAEKVLCSDEEL